MSRLRLLPSRVALVLALTLAIAPSARAQSPFVEGPYVDRVVEGTATLHVRTRAAVPVRVEFDTPTGRSTRESPSSDRHRIILSGFAPGTRVSYRVTAAESDSAEGSFVAPAATSSAPVTFAVVGDTRDGDAVWARIAGSIDPDASFVVHLGDYVPQGGSDAEWVRFFDAGAPILRRAAIVPVLGNHELIAPGGRELYLDRFAIAGPAGGAFQVLEHEGVRILALDSNAPIGPGSEQFRFAERELARAEAEGSLRGLVVAIHHGPFSSGRHGEFEPLHTNGLLDAMRRAHVDLIVSGHDHMYERGEVDGLRYVVSGGGGSPLYRANDRRPYQQRFAAAYHHLRVRLDGATVAFDAIRPDGTPIERCSAPRGRSFVCTAGATPHRESGVSRREDFVDHHGSKVAVAAVALLVVVALVAKARRSS